MSAANRQEIRERAEFALSEEMWELLSDAPEDGPRWVQTLARDVLALLGDDDAGA